MSEILSHLKEGRQCILLSAGSVHDAYGILCKEALVFKKIYSPILISPKSDIIKQRALLENVTLYELPVKVNNVILNKNKIYSDLIDIENKIRYPVEKILFGSPEFYNFYKINEELALFYFIKIFNLFEEVIEKHKITIFFAFGEDRLHNLIPYFLIKKRDGIIAFLRKVPYYGITLSNDFFGSFSEMDKIESINNIENDNYEFIEYVNNIKNNKIYYDINKTQSFHKYSLKQSFLKIKLFISLGFENIHNIYKPFYISKRIISFLNEILKYSYFLTKCLKLISVIKLKLLDYILYKKINPNYEYLYFPLHFIEDAQIRVKFPEGYNQYELIKNICNNLPVGYKLIVKEHPLYIGGYSIKELFKLSRYPKIIIINPNVSSKEIFSKVKFVITINSTVGFEALFYNKIVFTLANSFYEKFPGVIKVESLNDIFYLLNNNELINSKKREIKDNLKIATLKLIKSSIKYNYHDFTIENFKEVLPFYINYVNYYFLKYNKK